MDEEIEERVRQSGMVGYLSKPFKADELNDIISKNVS